MWLWIFWRVVPNRVASALCVILLLFVLLIIASKLIIAVELEGLDRPSLDTSVFINNIEVI
jgi:hypothetical protein